MALLDRLVRRPLGLFVPLGLLRLLNFSQLLRRLFVEARERLFIPFILIAREDGYHVRQDFMGAEQVFFLDAVSGGE